MKNSSPSFFNWFRLALVLTITMLVCATLFVTRDGARAAGNRTNGKIAFVTNRNGPPGEIYVMDSDGRNQRNITNSTASETRPVFSPNGLKIAFVRDFKGIFVMNPDGTGETQILDGVAAGFSSITGFPNWSPDGSKIAFNAVVRNSQYAADIYVIKADGTGLTQLTTDPADDTAPCWSPDGAKVAFSSIRDRVPGEVNYEIYVMNADGSNQTRLTNNTKFDFGPAWSPDGTRIAFGSRRDDDFEVYVMNANGSGQTRLTNSPEQDSDPKWSPDGTRIAFMSSRGGRFGEIYTMNPDGTDLVNVTNADGFDMDPSWQSIASASGAPSPTPTSTPTPSPSPSPFGEIWEPFTPEARQAGIEVVSCSGGRTFVKVTVTFNTAGFRVADWGTIQRSGSDFAADSRAERWTGGSAQVIISVDGVYDLGAVAPGSYTFTLKSGGALVKTTPFVVDPSASASPVDDVAVFVWQHYLDFLGRQPDGQGFRFWTGNFAECGANAACLERKRIDTSAAFFKSIEFQETGDLVYRLYRASYGRMPRREEFMPDSRTASSGVVVGAPGWQQQLANNIQAFTLNWVNRSDFKFNFDQLNSTQFVDRLLTNGNITLAPEVRSNLIADLDAGRQTRAGALLAIANDQSFRRQEFNRAFVLMQYFGYLQRNPDEGRDTDMSGYNFWLNKLNEFDGDYVRADMVKAFITSGEYRGRFCGP